MRMELSHLDHLRFSMGGQDQDMTTDLENLIQTNQGNRCQTSQGNQCQTNNMVHPLETSDRRMGMLGISNDHKILQCSLDMDHLAQEIEEILCHRMTLLGDEIQCLQIRPLTIKMSKDIISPKAEDFNQSKGIPE